MLLTSFPIIPVTVYHPGKENTCAAAILPLFPVTVYYPGKENTCADILSHYPQSQSTTLARRTPMLLISFSIILSHSLPPWQGEHLCCCHPFPLSSVIVYHPGKANTCAYILSHYPQSAPSAKGIAEVETQVLLCEMNAIVNIQSLQEINPDNKATIADSWPLGEEQQKENDVKLLKLDYLQCGSLPDKAK